VQVFSTGAVSKGLTSKNLKTVKNKADMKKKLQKFAFGLLLAAGSTTNTFAQWQTVGNAGFSAGDALNTSLAFSSSGEPYVAYSDGANSQKATVMKFNGTNWVNVGTAGFSAGSTLNSLLTIAFSPSGEPYVAYSDGANSQKATVMKFNGTNWVNVGTAGFSAGSITYGLIAFAFSNSGEPYVAYRDGANSDKATAMKFNGTNWVNVGTAGFSAGVVGGVSLAFSPSGEPYVAYQDATTFQKLTAMKFDGTNWVNVGTAGFSAGAAGGVSLAFSPSGEPYVAYQDATTLAQLTAMKFNGTSWVNVGTTGFTPGQSVYPSLAFSPSGEPYVAFSYVGNSLKASVMKFNGTTWVNVGTPGFSAGPAPFLSLAFSSNGEPYVAYSDGANSDKATVMKFAENTMGINEGGFQNTVSVYPNPANNFVTLSDVPSGSAVRILDITGKTVYSLIVAGEQTTINTSDLINGIYLIRIENNRNSVSRKLVVNR